MKRINGMVCFEVTFNAIDVKVDDNCECNPDAFFKAVIDNWCEGYSEMMGACLDEVNSDYREDEEDD